ncbi:amino acid/amide ABC transporter membrane protein 1 (HAAT family) [Nonomuraea polychroma]|uniref:Amino acid/amide ABC transporter membrane protein 1 (HAAT family) n=1 Tax=Nonomuraea polychroma TaxID=46176 RepID=A0A438LZL3_9ACTN|nr:branched-chain amino acid ABC transporter permease [Nonomuraea polychroma]RVX38797.1 amino acid/amide ABC transporter membrane protein 1 (HAAT family) [Nonomuraea polychroma]
MSWLTHTLNGLAYGSLLFLVASGLTITFGLMRTVNLAHGAFYLLGGYLAYDLASRGTDYWLAMVIGVVGAAVAGMAAQRLLLHRLTGQELPQIVLTLGVALVIGDQILAHYGGDPISPPTPPGLTGPVELGALVFPKFRLVLIGIALGLALLVSALLRYTPIGAKVRAAVDDQEMARSVGIRVPLIFLLVFGLGTGLAAFAGVWGGAFTSLSPDSGFEVLLLALVVVVVGGLGSIPGAYVAALAVGLVEEFGRVLFPGWAMFTLYASVALVLALRPQGLLGKAAPR